MSESTDLIVPSPEGSALMRIIDRAAMDPQFDVAKLEALLAVKERWEASEARKAYVVALGNFKADAPQVMKDKAVSFGAGKAAYKHATLDNASEQIGAALAQHGLSHRWNVEQFDGGLVKVTCIITHVLGHSESVSMQAKPDDSGSKNSIQAIGSTTSYLQRYTLFAATGLAPKNEDNDGAGDPQVHALTQGVREDYLKQIALLTDKKTAESLWQTIASDCTKAGDVTAYAELKAALSLKVKILAKTKEEDV